MKYMFCLLFAVMVNAPVAASNDSTKGIFFRDIDYFNLTGIGKLSLKELDRFPYYRVIEIDDDHRVIESITRQTSAAELYERQEDHWINRVYNRDAVEHNYIFTYVLKNRVIQLYYMYVLSDAEIKKGSFKFHYQFGNKFKLFKASVRTEFAYNEYTLDYRKNAKWIEPSPNIESILPRFNWRDTLKETYSIIDEHVVRRETKFNSERNVQCFDLIDEWGYKHNIFWEYFFFLMPIECKVRE